MTPDPAVTEGEKYLARAPIYGHIDDASKVLTRALEIVARAKDEEFKQIIENYPNPYPKDIFVWDNKESLNFNRGRFNQHCFEIVENIRQDILKELSARRKE